MKPHIAVYPGTFDPVTLGHIDIIKRALNLCDYLIIGVAACTGKNPLFKLEKRIEMIQEIVQYEALKNVTIKPINKLTADFVYENQASLIIRGVRNNTDFDHEYQIHNINKTLNHNIETIFLPTSLQYQFVSSSAVRQIHAAQGDLTQFLHTKTLNLFK